MNTFKLDDIAHAIVNGKAEIINVLKSMALSVSDDADEETVFKFVLEHQQDERVRAGIIKVHREKPYNRHCTHCIEAIHPLTVKGVAINKSMTEE